MRLDGSAGLRIVYGYSAYGETQALGVDGDIPNNANQYTARENDGLIGGISGGTLYYYRARYYDPVLKRFIAEDPIGLVGGFNVSAYVDSSPINFSDPLGLLQPGELGLWDIYDSIVQGTINGWNRGYYNCVWNELIGPDLSAPLPGWALKEIVVKGLENMSGPGAKLFYSLKYPTWFKAGGVYSKVYVPNAIKSAKLIGGRLSALGFVYVGAKTFAAGLNCSACLD